MDFRTRFAPSPTGYMHLGNLRTALYTYLMARRNRGTFILRIEDTDQEREIPGAVDVIYKNLATAGITYDEGPNAGGDYGPYIQSQRKDMYLPYAHELIEKGGAYYCFCTKERLEEARAEAEAKGETFKYDKRCLHLPPEEVAARLAAGEPHVIRQNVPLTGTASFDDVLYGHVEVDCSTLDDNVLIKADGLPTYNFANVIDDHLMKISHVMRGNEYLSSAPKYNLLYGAFGWQPPIYIHVTPVMATATRKLSKRHGDPTFDDLLEKGYLPEAIVNYVVLLGWSPKGEREFFTLKELEEVFDLEGISKSPAMFDIAKLNWFNAEYIRALPDDVFLDMAQPYFASVLGGREMDEARLAELVKSRVEALSDIPGMIDFLAELPEFEAELYVHKKMKTTLEVALGSLELALPALEAAFEWSEENILAALMAVVEGAGLKNGQVLWPVRIAISGRASTPGGASEIAYLLGREETLDRMRRSIERLK